MKIVKDRVAVITGAASGIGRATALEFARKGCHLAIADVNASGLDETAGLLGRFGTRVTRHIVNVSDKEAMESFAADAVSAHGKVNIVVNNAGVTVTAPFEQQTIEDFEWIVGINFWGVVYGCKYFLPALRKAGEGHIVNISSILGLVGAPMQSSYVCTKFAVRGFSESLRAELADAGIGVTVVHPGIINTNIVKSSRQPDSQGFFSKEKIASFFERFALPPSAVAEGIVRAVERNEARVLVSRETYFADFAKRLFPVWTGEIMRQTKR